MSTNSLNTDQLQAVRAPDGPKLVLAGAGSGKTRVIVERICWLIAEQGLDPRNILALTFTNRAAREMKERVLNRLKEERFTAWMGTFHSFGLFLLRREMDNFGRSKSFTICDDSDQLSLMKRLVKDLPSDERAVTPREALEWMSSHKASLTEPEDDPGDETEEVLFKLWRQYHDALWRADAVDFDDLLVLPARLLRRFQDVRDRYRRRYRHILVDEYQDTNHAQYVIASCLAGKEGNLFVVGDEDQSIYSWRGADINNILRFEKDFPTAQVYRLEQNYRSTAPILAAANALVAHNKIRLGKDLWTESTGGEKIRVYAAPTAEDEAIYVVEAAQKAEGGLNECVVLYRTNSQARIIEETCRRMDAPYRVIGGIRFYSRKEIKDVVAYLRLIVNSKDDEAFRRIINVPSRGIGAVTLDKIQSLASAKDCALFEALPACANDPTLSPRARETLAAFLALINEFKQRAQKPGVQNLVESLLEKTGYRAYVQMSDEKDFRTRLEVIDEFVSACANADSAEGAERARKFHRVSSRDGGDGCNDSTSELSPGEGVSTYVEFGGGDEVLSVQPDPPSQQKAGEISGLTAYLQDMALLTDADTETTTEGLTLMTCHNAKGLEFDHVFLVGFEDGLLPHAITFNDAEEIEEERRLCYVSMTRARKTLTLVYARTRRIYGEQRVCEPSRFLAELPKEHLEFVETGAGPLAKRSGPAANVAENLKMGVQVRHASLGVGTVMYTRGAGDKLRAKIRFQTGRTREFMVNKAPLEIVEGRKR